LKIKYHLLFLLLVFLILPFFGQDKKIIDSLETVFPTLKTDSLKLKALNNLSRYSVDLDPEKSIGYAKDALRLAEASGHKFFQAMALNNIGNGYYNLADYKTCLDYYLKALKIQESINNKKGILTSTGAIGNVYISLKKPDDALKYFEKALSISKELGNKIGVASCLISMGTIYSNKKDFTKALDYFFNSVKIFQELNDEDDVATCYNNIADAYQRLKDFPRSLSYITKAAELYEKTGNTYGQSLALNNYGDFYHSIGKEEKALDYFKKGLAVGKLIDANDHVLQSYKGMTNAYKNLGKYKEAFEVQELFQQMNDSIYNIESSKQIEEMQARFDSEKKEQTIALLTKDKKLQDEEIYRQTMTSRVIIFVGVLILMLAFVAIRGFIQKRKANLELAVKNEKIEMAYNIIEDQHKDIKDSINYAKRIQYALLANNNLLDQNLPAHFILFEPKDIVSGDFYWGTEHENKFYLAVCDSTGHGVPGAFMSLLNIGFLSEAIKEKNISAPNEILNYVRKRLIDSIDREDQKDGMDAILICIDKTTNVINYSAANNGPVLIRNKELIKLPKDKMPVGRGEKTESFGLFTIECQKGDMLYLYTDGFADQFGGKNGKKFKYKQLNEILSKNSNSTLKDQKEILNASFSNWKGNLEQVDDVCIIGIRI
jgi:serine phosphatase RsbU (regulator of sigma subunit)